MLKNTWKIARRLIFELFNSVILGGVNPTEWKFGNIIITLKCVPGTDINNYRSITLINCLSKVITSIVAQRIAEAVESSGLQNSFKKGHSCADNIFILNSLLELNKNRKLLSYLLVLDLQEAYDRVDRRVLFRKLQQLNFPTNLVTFLEDYYLHDCIVTEATGTWTNRQYQQKELRQGCQLSSLGIGIGIFKRLHGITMAVSDRLQKLAPKSMCQVISTRFKSQEKIFHKNV